MEKVQIVKKFGTNLMCRMQKGYTLTDDQVEAMRPLYDKKRAIKAVRMAGLLG